MLIKQTKDMTDAERIAVENSNNCYLQALAYVNVGTIFNYAGTTAPDTFLICNGASLDTTEYADLFSVIGYNFGGSGDTFKIPNLSTSNSICIIKAINRLSSDLKILMEVNADQTYDAESENAQSGKAVSEAIANVKVPSVDQTYDAESENAQSGKSVAQAMSTRIPKPTYNSSPPESVLLVNRADANLDPMGFDDPVLNDSAFYCVFTDGLEHTPKSQVGGSGWFVRRDPKGNVYTGKPVDNEDCANKKYVDDKIAKYVPLIEGQDFCPRAHITATDGSPSSMRIEDPYWFKYEKEYGAIPQRQSNGNLYTNTPVDDLDCANKQYVDALKDEIAELRAMIEELKAQ